VGHVAALLAGEKVGNLRDARALVVGAGAMAKLAARALRMHDIQAIPCINRTDAHAEALARQVQGHALSWGRLPEGLAWADVVITATGAPHTIIHVSDVVQALPQRHGRPLVFVDIAVPRDVEGGVGNLPDVYRYDIDDLRAVLDANLAQRQAAVPAVEAIVHEEAENFWRWLHHRQIVPVITDLRCKVLALVDAELAQAWRRLEGVNRRSQQAIARLAYRIVNKLLHEPTVRLKARAANDFGYAQVVRELFALNTPDETLGQAPTAADNAPMDVPSQAPRSVLPCPSGGMSDD
jgi:glutamyl-tRNA reductase